MDVLAVAIRRVRAGQQLPHYASTGAAGMDLAAAIEAPIIMRPRERASVPSGFAVAIPDGYEGQVRPRSGLALEHGLTVANAPGTIDADYRGEIRVILVNLGSETVTIHPGDRVAQLVVAPVSRVVWTEAETLPPTDRAAAGFGSTGVGKGDPPGGPRDRSL